MLTKTSITAIRLLLHVAQVSDSAPASVRLAAGRLQESPTYLAKVAGLLVRSGILRGQRGVAGGISLARPPAAVSMLDIVQACQGAILGDFCDQAAELRQACAFHQASAELHAAILKVLSSWSLEALLKKPGPTCQFNRKHVCCFQLTTPAAVVRRG
jgi:Rrf2 family protein